jgi:hypothetical protein
MKLKPEEVKAKAAEILANLSDQAKVSAILAELVEHNDDAVVEVTKASETATKLTADNENLRNTNMQLFLKVGSSAPKPDAPNPKDNTPKFEELFDDKGNLK